MNLKNKAFSNDNLSFWGHLDVLRNYLFKIIISIFLCSIVAFCFKDILFSIVLAPKNSDFITYQIINNLAAKISPSTVIFAPFSAVLINTELAQQFIVHMKVAFYAGLFCVSPYIIYMLFKFIAPALYSNEKKYLRDVSIYSSSNSQDLIRPGNVINELYTININVIAFNKNEENLKYTCIYV